MSVPAQPRAPLADDPYLRPYLHHLHRRRTKADALERRLVSRRQTLTEFASGHEYYGLHLTKAGWLFREWAPHAESLGLIGDFCDWRERPDFALSRVNDHGDWEISLPHDALHHEDLYRLHIRWPGGTGDRIPAYARRVVQDEATKIWNAQVWTPASPFHWRHAPVGRLDPLLIYECHVGMAQEKEGVGTYEEFRRLALPRIVAAGYNAMQLMAVMEHPYYASFGYQVSSFFAASSRFGTPEELKALVDEAHGAGLLVIMDLVHSHAVSNDIEGLSRLDGSPYQYFHDGARGYHPAWNSRCFDYSKPEVLHFLLSNCRFWLEAYRFDGFRFDGVTSMLYRDHGLGEGFASYDSYFSDNVDEDAVAYLTLANKLVHGINPHATTIAEDVSGMPGLGAPPSEGGCGFDCRLAMGVPDCWFKLANDVPDEHWKLDYLWHELTNRRKDEETISYVESHDQALVGGKSMIFELIDAPMYTGMHASDQDPNVDRGMALHKMMRLATLATCGRGYLNFMGNEFGHPEWIDFPREGNNWSYHYARRQWSLRDDPNLKYHYLADFDKAMLALFFPALSSQPKRLLVHTEDKVLAVARGELCLAFNFHPSRSLTNYAIETPPGRFLLVLDTDEARFGGYGRLTPRQEYHGSRVIDGAVERHVIRLYLPARTAIVLRRQLGDA